MNYKKLSLVALFIFGTINLYCSGFMDYIKDSGITSKVKYKLLVNKAVSGLKIHVTTKNRIVYLKGKASSKEEAELAEKFARSVKRVKDVVNNITIVPPKKNNDNKGKKSYLQSIVIDPSITGRVKSAFLLNQNINGMKIRVTTKSGTVYLEGYADSKRQKAFAEKIARGVSGVKDVKNLIIVR